MLFFFFLYLKIKNILELHFVVTEKHSAEERVDD